VFVFTRVVGGGGPEAGGGGGGGGEGNSFATYTFFSKTWPIHTRLMQLTPRTV